MLTRYRANCTHTKLQLYDTKKAAQRGRPAQKQLFECLDGNRPRLVIIAESLSRTIKRQA